MSDDTTQDAELLLDSDNPDAGTEPANDTELDLESVDGEQEQQGLDLEETPQPKGEDQKLKQIKAWQKKIDNGASIEDLPSNLGWLKEYLRAPVDEETVKKSARQVAEEVIKSEREEADFQRQYQELKDANLGKELNGQIIQRYKSLRNKGLSKVDAIALTKEVLKIDLNNEALKEKRKKMAIPKPGAKPESQDWQKVFDSMDYEEARKHIPEEEMTKILSKQLRG